MIGGIIVDFGTFGDMDRFWGDVTGVGEIIGESVGNEGAVEVEGVE